MLLTTVWGNFPQWLIVIGLAVSLATFLRGNRSIAITNLRAENEELSRECRKLTADNAALRATRDLEPVQQALLAAIAQHEIRAEDRADKTLEALDRHLTLTGLIADRLGANHVD